MTKAFLVLALLAFFIPRNGGGQSPDPANLSSSPLTKDEIQVYQTFLLNYRKGSSAIYLDSFTFAFEPDPDELTGCLRGIAKTPPSTVIHRFQTELRSVNRLHIVDPRKHEIKDPGDAIAQGTPVDQAVDAGIAAGILSLSEVAFNASHSRAALRFEFHCGRLCGSSALRILEKRRGIWKMAKSCGMTMF